jgi:hypothetical protein
VRSSGRWWWCMSVLLDCVVSHIRVPVYKILSDSHLLSGSSARGQ